MSDDFFQQELYATLEEELFRLLGARLANAPKPEDITVNCKVIYDDLREIGMTNADTERLRWTLRKLGRDSQFWPRTKDIREAMPRPSMWAEMSANPQRQIGRPTETEEQRAARMERGQNALQNIKDMLKGA